MEYNKLLSDVCVGDEFEGFYILKDAFIKTSSNGKPFLSGSLADRSGNIELKVWDYNGPVGAESADAGRVVKVRGEVSEYKGTLQFTAARIRFTVDDDVYDIANLVPVAPIDVDKTVEDIYALAESLDDEDYKNICKTALERHIDVLKTIPAGKSMHHSFISGLLMHTSNMLKIADFLAGLYSDIIDRSLLITGTLMHDLAKEKEFARSELGIVTDYTTKGQLLGHLVMGAEEAGEICRELGVPEDKRVLLQHMLLSHHGEPEFGAAVKPMCAEAELLSHLDLIDSRMEIYAEHFAQMNVGDFSGRVYALDKKIYKHF